MTERPGADPRRPSLTDPVHFFAFGFGAGLSPRAPGTVGTLVALPPYLLIADQPLAIYSAIVVAAAALGVWLCGVSADRLAVHDHPGIVWDEFVGMWIALWAVPVEPLWIAAAFVAFRIFDIGKPWPIGWLDKHARGGLGIMVDDIVAGILACAMLHAARLIGG